ncbi:MAG: SurA N-terminal domain-containing protein, partial [Candidatus Bathyarchaeota archaeon]|nr:SurA N-terminal domain-containing protein [Candidatus Bathyarchaeota archaeon]
MALVIVAAIAIAAFGYYQTQIAPRHKTVLQVGETKFSLGHFERRLRLELETNPTLQQLASELPNYVLSQLEDEGVLLEAAASLGIEVTEDDIDAEIGQRTGVAPGGDERLFASAYRQDVRDSGLHTDEYRRMLRADLLEQGMQAKFRDDASAREPQARLRLIAVETEEQAQEVIQRLEAGEDFAALARELSLDPAT